jgi:hypothetical protein
MDEKHAHVSLPYVKDMQHGEATVEEACASSIGMHLGHAARTCSKIFIMDVLYGIVARKCSMNM